MDSIEYRDRRDALEQAQAEVMAIKQRFDDGEITLEQAQAEVMAIKRNAKKNGQITRNQAFTGRY